MARRGRMAGRIPHASDIRAETVLLMADGESPDLIVGLDPHREAVRDRGLAAVAAGYLEIIDGVYRRTEKGDRYIDSKMVERIMATNESDEWKRRQIESNRRAIADRRTYGN
jgi:hypothetical protein